MNEKRQTVCFAYFANGHFIGWYSDSFGTITKCNPKIYRYDKEQVETIRSNFRAKLRGAAQVIAESIGKVNPAGGGIMMASFNADTEQLSRYRHVELRAVACPHYDGPDPDFDRDTYLKKCDEWHEAFRKTPIFKFPQSTLRMHAMKRYEESHPMPAPSRWIYADRALVNEWASKEPVEFLEVIK